MAEKLAYHFCHIIFHKPLDHCFDRNSQSNAKQYVLVYHSIGYGCTPGNPPNLKPG